MAMVCYYLGSNEGPELCMSVATTTAGASTCISAESHAKLRAWNRANRVRKHVSHPAHDDYAWDSVRQRFITS